MAGRPRGIARDHIRIAALASRWDTLDAAVVGAGVAGLAVARALAARGFETLILEAREQFGTEASERNSEVAHAGIHYPQGWLPS